jgi:hypothetical protein
LKGGLGWGRVSAGCGGLKGGLGWGCVSAG